MSFTSPAFIITRQSVVGMEGMFTKMFDPPTESPATPDELAPTNPVPEVMAAAGLQDAPGTPHTVMRDLMHGAKILTWDSAKELNFFLFRDGDNPVAAGTFPAPTTRVPRGAVYHAKTHGHGPPPHTIHWHGIEPTPQNDGVGHCSMELGDYTYQWQPNFIGTYFYHCHRNTMQHFEFGLYGLLPIEPPDAYFATQQDPAIPIGHCRDGKRRTAASLAAFPEFPDFNANPVDAVDPLGQYPADPHAHTVAYDVEALWVFDDRDSVWSDLAADARTTYPKHGNVPGVDDRFHENVGTNGFFAFNDFNADYWFVTGVPVPAHKGGTGDIPAGVVIPAELNSGVAGSQVSINARVGQTIFIRALDAAYNCTEVTLPVDAVIIAWDGRALGVPPYTRYNHAYRVQAGTPIHMSTARRCDILIRANNPLDSFATVSFINTRGQVPGEPKDVLVTARIPLVISGVPQVFTASGRVTDTNGLPLAGIAVNLTGAATAAATTDTAGNYSFPGLPNGSYTLTPASTSYSFQPLSRQITINGADIANNNFVGSLVVSTSITVNYAEYISFGSLWIILGSINPREADRLITITLERTGQILGTCTTSPLGSFSLILHNSPVVPQPGDTLRLQSATSTMLNNIPVSIR